MNVHKLKDVKREKPEAAVPATKEHHENPFVSFRREMDRLFDDFFTTKTFPSLRSMTDFSTIADTGDLMPQVDVRDEDDKIMVTAELPGMKEKDVELTLNEGVLTLKGEKKSETKEEKGDLRMSERRYGSFMRSFRLPKSVDDGAVEARFEDGVLTVMIPKRAEALPKEKKIKITSK